MAIPPVGPSSNVALDVTVTAELERVGRRRCPQCTRTRVLHRLGVDVEFVGQLGHGRETVLACAECLGIRP